MKSDTEFYLGEYRRCCRLYQECPYEERRRRDLYSYMGASMLKAYIEAKFTRKQSGAEKCPAERSETW